MCTYCRRSLSAYPNGYIDSKTGERILCGDDARFFNHSTDPTVADAAGNPYECVALRDIALGDEITSDYFLFDRSAGEKLPGGAGT